MEFCLGLFIWTVSIEEQQVKMSKFWETCKEDDPMEEDVDMCSLPKFTKSTLFSSLSSLLNDESIIDMLLKCEDNSLDKFVEETERAMECFIRESVQQIQVTQREQREILEIKGHCNGFHVFLVYTHALSACEASPDCETFSNFVSLWSASTSLVNVAQTEAMP